MTNLNDEEKRLLRLLRLALEQQASERGLNNRLHAEHHRAVAEWIARENRRRERWDKISQSVLGGLILAAITGLLGGLGWLGRLALAALSAHPQAPGH